MTTIANKIKISSFHKEKMMTIFVVLGAIMTGLAIVNGQWLYLGIMLIPLVIYICIVKPFIFPFGLYVFLLPLDSVFVISNIGKGTALTKFAALLIISVLLFKGVFEKKFKQPDTAAILWTLFVLLSVISYLWAIDPEKTLAQIRNSVGILMFYLIISSYKIHRKEYETLKWFIIGGGIFAGVFSLFNYQQLYSDTDSIDRISVHIGGHSSGLNNLAFALLLPVATGIEKILEQRKMLIKLILCIGLGIILFSIILTGCRGAMLGVATIFAINIFSIKQKVSYVTMLIIIGMVLVPFLPNFFFERWGDAIESGGSGRLDIWYVGLMSLKKYGLIGAGLGNFPLAFNEFYKIPVEGIEYGRVAHNTFLEISVELGIVGISLMILAMWKSYQKIQYQFKNKNTADSIMLKAAFWGIIIASVTANNTWNKAFWLLFMLISMYKNLLAHNKLPYK